MLTPWKEQAVGPTNLHPAARLVATQSIETEELAAHSKLPIRIGQSAPRLEQTAMMLDATEDLTMICGWAAVPPSQSRNRGSRPFGQISKRLSWRLPGAPASHERRGMGYLLAGSAIADE